METPRESLPQSFIRGDENPDVKNNFMLVLSKSQQFDKASAFVNTLKDDCELEVEIVDALDTAEEKLYTSHAKFLFHDWDSFDEIENHRFHQRLAKLETLKHLCHIICAEKISPQLQSLASEIRLDRVVTKAALRLNAVNEINSLKRVSQEKIPILKELLDIQLGRLPYNQERIDEIVEQCHKDYPMDPSAQMEYGNLCYRKGQFNEADKIAESLLMKDSHNVRAMTLKSRVLLHEGKINEATGLLTQANFLSPKNSSRLCLLADMFVKKGEKLKARQHYQEAVEADPSDPDAVQSLTTFEVKEHNLEGAIEFFQQALSEEEVASTFNNIGVQFVKAEDYKTAIQYYEIAESALHTDLYRHKIFFNMALAFKYQKDFEKALLFLESSLKIDPTYEKAKRQRAIVLKLLGSGSR